MVPATPRDLIRASTELREPERRRLLALDDFALHALHTEWNLPGATTARVAAGVAEHHVTFDAVKAYRNVLQGRRPPRQPPEVTAQRKPPPSGEERHHVGHGAADLAVARATSRR